MIERLDRVVVVGVAALLATAALAVGADDGFVSLFNGKVGFLYDESRRGWLVNVGDLMVIDREGDKLDKRVVSKISDKAQIIKEGYYKSYKTDEWNQYEIYLNQGDLKIYVNNLLQNEATGCQVVPGKICLQSEGGAVQYRNIVMIPILEGKPAEAAK